jgi:hypothetical protein
MSFPFYEEDDEDDTLPTIPEELIIPEAEAEIFDQVADEIEPEYEAPELIEVVKIKKKDYVDHKEYSHKMKMRLKMIQDIRSYTLKDFMKNEKARKILEKTWSNKFYRYCGNHIDDVILDYFEDAKDRDLNIFELIEDDYVFKKFSVLFMDLVKFHVKRTYSPDIFYYKPRLALSFIHKLEKEKYKRTQEEMQEREQKMKETSKHFNWGTKTYDE